MLGDEVLDEVEAKEKERLEKDRQPSPPPLGKSWSINPF